MSSVKFARSLAVAACGAVLFGAVPAMAETLVVRASGPSAGTFSAGRKLPDGGSVTLKAGDVLTLLDGRGTRTLRGPGVFGTSGSATGGGSGAIASFIGARNSSRARTGAVRGPGALAPSEPRSPNLWYVDYRNSATVCIADPANVKVWRASKDEAATLAISGKGGKASLTFEPGSSTATWPAELPVTEGAAYQLSATGAAKPVTITFTVLGAGAEGLESTASTLIGRKCNAQLDLLIETVALPDPTPDSPG